MLRDNGGRKNRDLGQHKILHERNPTGAFHQGSALVSLLEAEDIFDPITFREDLERIRRFYEARDTTELR